MSDSWSEDDEDDRFDDEDTKESFLGQLGCLFPENCCMPGEHYTSECHTSEDMEHADYRAREDEIERDLLRLMEFYDNQKRALLVERITAHHFKLAWAENKAKEGQ